MTDDYTCPTHEGPYVAGRNGGRVCLPCLTPVVLEAERRKPDDDPSRGGRLLLVMLLVVTAALAYAVDRDALAVGLSMMVVGLNVGAWFGRREVRR